MNEFLFPLLMIVFAIGLSILFMSKTKTWLRGYGACNWLDSTCFRQARPRKDCKSLIFMQTEWYCNKHYHEQELIRLIVDAEYKRTQQNNRNVTK